MLSQINPSLPVHQVGETTTTTIADAVKEGASKLSDQGKFILIFRVAVQMLNLLISSQSGRTCFRHRHLSLSITRTRRDILDFLRFPPHTS